MRYIYSVRDVVKSLNLFRWWRSLVMKLHEHANYRDSTERISYPKHCESIADVGLNIRSACAHLSYLDIEIVHGVSEPNPVNEEGSQSNHVA